MRDHLRQLEASGVPCPRLHPEPPPIAAAHVYYYWQDMSMMRSPGMMGPGVLEPQTIVGWQQLRNIHLMPVEVDMLLSLESAYRIHVAEVMKRKNSG